MKPSQNHNPDEIDPRLFELLDQLRPTPARDPEAAARGRKKYLTELKNLKFEAPAPSKANSMPRWLRRLFYKHEINDNQREVLLMNNRTQRFTLTGALIVITLLVFLFGGAGMTALASQSSLPGDALYPVKTSLEQTRVALARNAADRAQLQMEFAERRLGEIAGLIEEGRFENIPTATAEFETYIRNALAELETIAMGDPEQAALLAGQVSEALTRYAHTLTGMLDQVPESVRLEMRRTLQNTQAAGLTGEMEFSGAIESMAQQTWMIGGRTVGVNSATEVKGPFLVGDIVKVHAFQNADGSLTAREIERVRAGQTNENENDNSNTDTHANENMNDNGNANLNTNDNSNEGAVQNQNQNMNQDQNQNGNQNWNQNDNQNMNQNQNQNQNQNSNQNWNHNQNDNQNDNQNWNQNDNGNGNDNQNQNRNSNDDDDDDD
jgi:hypothetical protein